MISWYNHRISQELSSTTPISERVGTRWLLIGASDHSGLLAVENLAENSTD
jgi:hypothetical protein